MDKEHIGVNNNDATGKFETTVVCEPSPLPLKFVDAVHELERVCQMPILSLIQPDEGMGAWAAIGEQVAESVIAEVHTLPKGKPIALLLNSPGGSASDAYRLACRINQWCGSFSVIVPGRAKSAATLLSLGASRIVLGSLGELGPLDPQLYLPSRLRKKPNSQWISSES